MKFGYGIPSVLVGAATIVVVQAQVVLALSAAQVANIAEQISVKIDGQAPGSGVMIAKQDKTYFVLTAAHVVATDDEYDVITPDNQRHALSYAQVKKLPGVDLAVVQFTSDKPYQVANLGNSSQSQRGMTTYVAGWPLTGTAITQPTLLFQQGIISANSQVKQDDGYGLIYTNNTLPGMSGGPVLSEEGTLVGIHGRGETDRQASTRNPDVVVKVGYNLGIPISTFLSLAPQSGLNLDLQVATTQKPDPSATAKPSKVDDLIAQSGNQLYQGNNEAALGALNQVIATDPSAADAYRLRADARMSSIGWSFLEGRSSKNRDIVLAAQQDINEAIRLNPNLSDAYTIRAYLNFVLKDGSGATSDINQALRLDSQAAMPYILRANLLTEKQQWQNAIADANQALKLDANSPYAAFAYSARGLARASTRDISGGLQDLTQAIRLSPSNALFYMNRGTVLALSGKRIEGRADLEQSARLAQQKGRTEVYKEVTKRLNLLKRLP
ncbi:trypsin-like peptidase domain-containing protein [Acaryochloris sp. IP29b_bin.137]|uniref:tetratricopeptide repeat-containing S1 family peptidase n=1 Tax=Acaryochloris sp. IP29b_bin.137 TaxID=2969217 RepID=UPI002621E4A5|nr:trypsin-like peptidase domain-containing protein [Acaryochloris sp. IP29b_bin.137]